MKPKYIFLIRHGESMGNVDKTIYRTVPDWKVPLTDRGIFQAKDAGSKLSQRLIIKDFLIYHSSRLFDPTYCPLYIYSSPYES